MQYIALLLLVANIAFFGYHYMFGPQARVDSATTSAAAQSPSAEGSTLRLVTEVEPSDLEPRSGS